MIVNQSRLQDARTLQFPVLSAAVAYKRSHAAPTLTDIVSIPKGNLPEKAEAPSQCYCTMNSDMADRQGTSIDCFESPPPFVNR